MLAILLREYWYGRSEPSPSHINHTMKMALNSALWNTQERTHVHYYYYCFSFFLMNIIPIYLQFIMQMQRKKSCYKITYTTQ